jgi:hypothetical protein
MKPQPRPPAHSSLATWPARVLMTMVRAYQLLISPSLTPSCRFSPSCSAYSLQALQQHGAWQGSYLTLRRLGRCQPWCDGGHDPVPESLTPPRFLTRFLTRFSPDKTAP